MFSLFESLGELASNVGNVVLAPVQAMTDLAVAATQPLADATADILADIKSLK